MIQRCDRAPASFWELSEPQNRNACCTEYSVWAGCSCWSADCIPDALSVGWSLHHLQEMERLVWRFMEIKTYCLWWALNVPTSNTTRVCRLNSSGDISPQLLDELSGNLVEIHGAQKRIPTSVGDPLSLPVALTAGYNVSGSSKMSTYTQRIGTIFLSSLSWSQELKVYWCWWSFDFSSDAVIWHVCLDEGWMVHDR